MKVTEITSDYDFSKCPYNPSHKFDSFKYFHHINRCKDGQKVKHLYKQCQFNSLHIFKKQDIQDHEIDCPDSNSSKKKNAALKEAYSIHKFCQQQQRKNKNNRMLQECFEDCVCTLQQIQSVISKIKPHKRQKLKQLLISYQLLWRKQEKQNKQTNKK